MTPASALSIEIFTGLQAIYKDSHRKCIFCRLHVLTLSLQKAHICVFPDCFLAIFLPLFVSFRNKTNTLHAVRVSKTKLTLENALIGDLFVSRGKRESKYDERALFWSSLWSLDLSRPSNSLRKTHICVLPDCFSFSYFLASSCNF